MNAPVVNSNICVINAKGPIHLQLVFFVPVVKPQKPSRWQPGGSQNELPTPVIVDQLSFFLSGHTPSITEHLVSGFALGFSIHHEGQWISSHSQNLMFALHNPEVVDLKIEKELLAGHLSGPFEMPPFSPFRVSPSQRRHLASFDSYTTCPILRVPQSMTVFLQNFPVSTMQLLQMPFSISEQLAQCAFWVEPTSKMISELFLFTPLIIIYWVCNGMINTTLINACPWAVPVRVTLLSYSALLWNGWPRTSYTSIILFTYSMIFDNCCFSWNMPATA